MGLFTSSKDENASLADQEFVDLRDHEAPTSDEGAFNVRVAEMHQVEDIKALSGLVYDGDMLLVDVSELAGDEVALQRVTKEFKRIAQDVDGDVAGVGEDLLLVAPTGVKVDRSKVRVKN
jgi:SepF-like predicted cell division protein (DUF552 family)